MHEITVISQSEGSRLYFHVFTSTLEQEKVLHKVLASIPEAGCCSASMEHRQSQPAQAHL